MASQSRDIARLHHVIACPIEATTAAYPMAARNLLYECWAALLCKYLPEPAVVNLLVDWQGCAHRSIYMTADEHDEEESVRATEPELRDPSALECLSNDEIEMFTKSLEGSQLRFAAQEGSHVRDDFGAVADEMHSAPKPKPLNKIWVDEEFARLSHWLSSLRVVEENEREKHWPPRNIKTEEALIAYSLKTPDIGWLNLGTDLANLRHSALALLAAHFYATLQKKTDENFIVERTEYFFDTWNEIFEHGTFRLGLEHSEFMGVANGIKCKKVVYDFDLANAHFHCFPVKSYPQLREDFIEGQLDF